MYSSTDPSDRLELLKGSRWGVILGIVMIVLGVIAIALPAVASLAATFIFGWLILLSGIAQAIYAFQSRRAGQIALKLILGLLYAIAGLVILLNLFEGALAIAFVLGVFILVQGIFKVILAFRLKPAASWGWVLINGILGIVLGILIWNQWPFEALWILGLLLGITLFIDGLALSLFSLAARKALSDEPRQLNDLY
ncbi:HdeD family acid-resistance protein [Sphaerothrix gracilis]|uniref:HdeD family acid-resistance protein n=1 Tax=Sphaerothrix gracilis TaxID=3151835 RepID=UPI0031FD2148